MGVNLTVSRATPGVRCSLAREVVHTTGVRAGAPAWVAGLVLTVGGFFAGPGARARILYFTLLMGTMLASLVVLVFSKWVIV